MLCGVTATLGSNPSATATAARPHWGRAVLLCLPDLWARSLGVPVGGGPPARRPRRVLMLVAPLVFRAPEGPAAREARHPHFVRRCASKPARALRSLRRPSHQWRLRCAGWLGAAPRSPARPRRPSNFACNSPATLSNIEFRSLQLQWCVNRCIACLFGATRCGAETGGTIAARSSWWGETVGTFARAG